MATGRGGSHITQERPVSNLPEEVSFSFLENITNGFSTDRKLGAGAHGTVYMGILQDGSSIAVKKHVGDAPGTHKRETYSKMVRSLMEHKHDNLAKLLAFCIERCKILVPVGRRNVTEDNIQSLLCYEYLPNGSLHKKLFEEPASNLDWDNRFKIIKGICAGLKFMHTLPKPILHLDLKPQNIMLGDNMVPKLTDFAYSRLFSQKETHLFTKSNLGSVGYKAPEFLDGRKFSRQTDIYSLGLIIMEITTREKNSSGADQESARDFIKKVKKTWTDEAVIMSEYKNLDAPCLRQIKACIGIAIECVKLQRKERPNIEYIVENLNGLW